MRNYLNQISMVKILICVCVFFVSVNSAKAAPNVSSVVGTPTNGSSVTISGNGFGIKSSQNGAAPVAFGIKPATGDNAVNFNVEAIVGSWADTGYTESALHKFQSPTTSVLRNGHSTYSGTCNFNTYGTCGFEGGASSSSWFAQYWFHTGIDFTYGDGNNKIFRMWPDAGGFNNFRIQAPWQTVDAVVENVDLGNEYGPDLGYGYGRRPVTAQYECIDQAFGHACNMNYWSIGPASTGWSNFVSDMASNAPTAINGWHLFQFEYQSSVNLNEIPNSDTNPGTGIIRWWVDGKRVLDKTTLVTRNASNPSHTHPFIVGLFASHSTDASGSYYLNDPYIDNTFQRVEIGNNPDYDSCTLREIQIPTVWSDISSTFTVNQGSFTDGATGYVFVTDENGIRNAGFPITFGSGFSDTAAPSSPSGLSVM